MEVIHSAVVDIPEIKECMPYPVLSGLGLLCHAKQLASQDGYLQMWESILTALHATRLFDSFYRLDMPKCTLTSRWLCTRSPTVSLFFFSRMHVFVDRLHTL